MQHGYSSLSEYDQNPSPQLRQLSEEVGRIARALAMLSKGEHEGPERRESVGDRREAERREVPDRRTSGDKPMPTVSAIRAMKFIAPVRPEEEIILRANKLARVGELWQFNTQATVAGNVVAAGQLVLNLVSENSSAAKE